MALSATGVDSEDMNSTKALFSVSYSFRRFLIDQDLKEVSHQLDGRVLDLGGKKIKKRGDFGPPLAQVKSWTYLNLSHTEGADLVATAESIPLKSNSIDWVICTEVIEFINDPRQMLSEVNRVLKSGGKVFLTAPFLYRIHGSPYDLQRFTDEKLKNLFDRAQFHIEYLRPHGSFFTVLADFIKAGLAQIKTTFLRYALTFLLMPIILLLRWCDQLESTNKSKFLTSFTTGYVLIAKKSHQEKAAVNA